MGENQLAHFSQILVAIATSIMDDISHDFSHPRLPRCKFVYVTAVRSSDVIKGHQNFVNSFALKRAAAPCMVSLCSAHQEASNDIHVNFEVTLRSRDLRSPFKLDLMRS